MASGSVCQLLGSGRSMILCGVEDAMPRAEKGVGPSAYSNSTLARKSLILLYNTNPHRSPSIA
jgi:hypothetical protein